MKKEKILVISKIGLLIMAVYFLAMSIYTRINNNLYLPLSLLCTIILNILNFLTSSKKDK